MYRTTKLEIWSHGKKICSGSCLFQIDEKKNENVENVFIENSFIEKLHWKIRLKDCINPFLGLLTTGVSAAIFAFSNVIVKWMTGTLKTRLVQTSF